MPVAGATTHEGGFTLVELVVAMAIGIVVGLGAFGLLDFTSADVSRITERVHSTQEGRVVMERLMLELHSACVAPEVTPILEGSGESKLRFISAGGTEANLPNVEVHEVLYTAGTKGKSGTLIEKTWPAATVNGSDPPRYSFNESEPGSTVTLLSDVRTSSVEGKAGTLPMFRYYRYYRSGDSSPVYGQLYPTALSGTLASEAKNVAKVTVAFTVAPNGKVANGLHDDRPVPLEDTAILRLSTPTESTVKPNLACDNAT